MKALTSSTTHFKNTSKGETVIPARLKRESGHRVLDSRWKHSGVTTVFEMASSLLALVLATLGACEQPFSPEGPFLDRTVVFSLLAARSDTQFVRVYRTYYPPNDNPYGVDGDTPDTSAQVLISDGTRSVRLNDTVLTRGDGSSVHSYVAYPFRIEPGQTYSLSIGASGRAEAHSSTIVPGEGSVLIQKSEVLSDLRSHLGEGILMEVTLSLQAVGYIPRLAVEFQVVSTGTVLEREVPLILRTPDEENKNPVYPDIMRAETAPKGPIVIIYSLSAYAYTLRKIQEDFREVWFTRAKCYLVQTDQSLYYYYNIANGFRDSYSIRMDQPDYSNIEGGLGVFGSYNVDENSYSLSSYIFIPPIL
jgi:hypothetical protein